MAKRFLSLSNTLFNPHFQCSLLYFIVFSSHLVSLTHQYQSLRSLFSSSHGPLQGYVRSPQFFLLFPPFLVIPTQHWDLLLFAKCGFHFGPQFLCQKLSYVAFLSPQNQFLTLPPSIFSEAHVLFHSSLCVLLIIELNLQKGLHNILHPCSHYKSFLFLFSPFVLHTQVPLDTP